MNWKWPHVHGNYFLPWYVILWRVVWVGPLFIAYSTYFLLAAVSFCSIQRGKEVVRDGISIW